MTRPQIGQALRTVKLKKGRSRKMANKVISAWLKMRAEAEVPAKEELTDKQLRKILNNVRKALDRARDAVIRAPKTAQHEIAIEFHRIPRLDERIAAIHPEKGISNLILVAMFINEISEAISRTLRVYATKGGPSQNRGDHDLLLDLAELFEWLTGAVPTRKTKSYKYSDSGKPYGEFYNFIKPFWFACHKSQRGLDGTFKTWATQRKKGMRKSQFLTGLLALHPEWQ
jgi:hypothetical protein